MIGAMFLMNSCQKEEISEESLNIENAIDEEIINYRSGPGQRLRNRCFKLVFPLSLNIPDGTTVTVGDYSELFTTYRNWIANNPDSDERPTIGYPLTVTLKSDDSQVLVTSQDELQAIIDTCRANQDHDRPHNGCFSLIYPVNIDFPDGSSELVDSRRELHQVIRDWRQANPDADARPMLGYPLNVMLRDGTEQTLFTSAELDTLKASCRRGPRPWQRPNYLLNLGCYELVYPITLEYPDGSITGIENQRAYRVALVDWIRSNPGSDVGPEIVFPFDVSHRRTGVITNIDSQEDLVTAIQNCR
jgi:hypothetical protein